MREIKALPEYAGYTEEYGIRLEACKCFLCDAGETIIRQGQRGEYLFFIADGTAKVQVYNADGKTLLLSYSVSEGALGEVELMSGSAAATASVTAETELVCLAYPYWKAREALRSEIQFVNMIARDLARKLMRSTGDYLMASYATAESRMCAFLRREAENDAYKGTLVKAASATGTSYRHLQRVMTKLCDDGILKKECDGYRILNYAELEKRASVQ